MSTSKIALFGDSYISRLERFCGGNLKIPGEVRFYGIGGLNLDNYSNTLDKLILFRPDAVFISLGGNSINSKTKPKQLATKFKTIIEKLKSNGVKQVYVAEFTERGDFRDPLLDKEGFEDQRKKLNKIFRKEFRNFIVFRDIRFPSDYDIDLVHYNPKGKQKFFYNVRRVLLSFKNI